jgi:hypothetical protein
MNSTHQHTTDEVFGLSREVPLNYKTRASVDEQLIENLTRDKHLIIYGSSKQGKTSLRKHCLQESDYIIVQCSNKWALHDLLSNVLKRAGFQVEQSEKKTVSGQHKITASIGANFFGLGSSVGGEKEDSSTVEKTINNLDLDPADVNDVIAALKKINFTRYIVLEDFHYLPIETQQDFAVALKAFHEVSKICFIIIGVWLEEGRLVVYNGDLTGRIVAINADKWADGELRSVIQEGERLLNIQFDAGFKDSVLKESYGSVYIVQEVCRLACVRSGITGTRSSLTTIGQTLNVRELIKEVVDQQRGRYMSFLSQFAEGFQQTRLEMYKWLLYPIISATPAKLDEGFKYAEIRLALRERHPSGESLNPGNITQALQSTASLQVAKDIKPIILDYDQTNLRLNVVDRGFVIWLNNQDKQQLFEQLELPLNERDKQQLLLPIKG